jgi:hypothetical protein
VKRVEVRLTRRQVIDVKRMASLDPYVAQLPMQTDDRTMKTLPPRKMKRNFERKQSLKITKKRRRTRADRPELS